MAPPTSAIILDLLILISIAFVIGFFYIDVMNKVLHIFLFLPIFGVLFCPFCFS